MKSGIDFASQDSGVRAQDDLFHFANGQWLATKQIPPDKARYGSFDALRDKAEQDCRDIVEQLASGDAADSGDANSAKIANLYRSFMDQERVDQLGTTPLQTYLADVDSLTSTQQIPSLLGRWWRSGIAGLVIPFVNTDDTDSSRYVVFLEQAGLGLPDESFYRDEQYAAIREQYRDHVATMLELAGVANSGDAAGAVLSLETTLAAGHWDRVRSRDALATYNKFTRAVLADLAPDYDWSGWWSAMNAPSDHIEEIVVRQPEFLTVMSQTLTTVDLAHWQHWLRWHAIHEFAPYLSSEVVEANFDFYGRTLSGMPQLRERWKRGVALVEAALGEALGQRYVERHFPPEAKARMEELVANLVQAFRRDFADLEWMSPATRSEADNKLSQFTPKIGYPARWRDYSSLEIDGGDLVGNVARASAFETDRNWAKLGGPVDRDEWFMTPQTVNAYYNPGMNEIVFPAAILQPPFFDVTADDAVNYGGIGAVIGHELGHGFDDQGSRYDGAGELRDWWTAQDRERFDERAAVLIKQFDAQEPADAPGHHINGALTVGENIGDLGGLTIGFKAYQIACEKDPAPVLDGLTGEQRFFLGWAQVWRGKSREAEAIRLLAIDPHSPANARCNVARNLVEFYQAFDVVDGDGMWLPEADRVRIF